MSRKLELIIEDGGTTPDINIEDDVTTLIINIEDNALLYIPLSTTIDNQITRVEDGYHVPPTSWEDLRDKPESTTEEIDDAVSRSEQNASSIEGLEQSKVDKVVGKELSSNDFTDNFRDKLSGIQDGAEVNTVTSVAGRIGDVVLNKGDVGLPDVDNTPDSNKPVSAPQQEALDLKLDADANAVSASKLFTSRNISLSGDVSGSTSFDGSSDATIVVEVADDSHSHVISNVDGLQAELDSKADAAYVNTQLDTKVDKVDGKQLSTEDYSTEEKNKLSEVEAGAQVNSVTSVAGRIGDVSLDKTDVGLPNVDNTSDSNKPVSAPQQAALDLKLDADANAVSASKLATPRTISLSGDVSGSTSFDGSANATIAVQVADDSHSHVISNVDGLQAELDSKVDKVDGKQLSDENYTLAEKNKLAGVAVGATKNATDAQIRDRATHTGTQPISTISGLEAELTDKVSISDTRLTDAREWTATTVSQAEAEAGTSTTRRAWTSQRVRQAVISWWDGSTFKTKLDGIATGATKNSTDAQLRDRATHTGVQPISSVSGLQPELDSKADTTYVNTQLNGKVDKVDGKGLSTEDFTSAEKGKLAELENFDDSAIQAELGTKVDKVAGKELSTNDFTDQLRDKLASLESSHFRGTFSSKSALETAVPTAVAGDYADVDEAGQDAERYIWDSSDSIWVLSTTKATPLTAAQIKQLYESNPDTNSFDDAAEVKLEGIAEEATKNATDAYLLNRANHTGSQAIGTVTGLTASLSSKADQTSLDAVAASKVDKEEGKGLSTNDFTTTEKNKLSGIQAGATANATNAQLRDRTTHTGVQPISSVSGLQTELDSKATTTYVNTQLDTKVDKVVGKELSDENYTLSEKNKLGGIEAGATANATDAQLRARATHTGVQPIASVGGLQEALGGKVDNTDPRLTNSREWTASVVSQSEAEAGTSTTARKWTSQRVRQAILGWWNTSAFKTKLDGIEDGATKNATDAQLRSRATHTGVQPISSISGLQTGLDNKADTTYVNTQLDSKVDKTVSVVAGTGLSGGGTLSANRTLNVQYGTASGTAAQGNDSRLSDSREWTASVVSQAEAQAGTATTARKWTAQRVRQAILGWWNGSPDKTKLDGIESGAQVNTVTSVAGKTGAVTLTYTDVNAAPTSHTHPWSEVTSKPATATRWPSWSEVSSKPATFTPAAHNHSADEITSGVLAYARIPTIRHGDTDFANQSLNIGSSVQHATVRTGGTVDDGTNSLQVDGGTRTDTLAAGGVQAAEESIDTDGNVQVRGEGQLKMGNFSIQYNAATQSLDFNFVGD